MNEMGSLFRTGVGGQRNYRAEGSRPVINTTTTYGEGRQGANTTEEWTTVQRRRNKVHEKNNYGRDDLLKIATNIFVSNLPSTWNSSCLWKACSSEGILVDAYVLRKMGRGGAKFGFVRFVRVADPLVLLRSLNNLVFDGRKFRANIAKYGRNSSPRNGDRNVYGRYSSPRNGDGHIWDKHVRQEPDKARGFSNQHGMSYREMLVGFNMYVAQPSVIPKDSGDKLISIPNALNLRSVEWLDGCLVGEIKDLELLSKCMSTIQAYGLGDCRVRYVGGLCVLLEFKNKSVADCFLRNQEVNWSVWFAWLKHWDESFRQRSRIVWLRIYGVPVQGWDPNVFTSIAEKYGRVLVPFDCSIEANNFSFGQICILTSNLDNIDCHSAEVRWRSLSFKVRILEDGEWYPNFFPVKSEFGSEEDADADCDNVDLDEDSSSEDRFGNRDSETSLPKDIRNMGRELEQTLTSAVADSTEYGICNNQHAPASVDDKGEQNHQSSDSSPNHSLSAHLVNQIGYVTKLGSGPISDRGLDLRLDQTVPLLGPDYDAVGPDDLLTTSGACGADVPLNKTGSNRGKLNVIRFKDVLFKSNLSKVKCSNRTKNKKKTVEGGSSKPMPVTSNLQGGFCTPSDDHDDRVSSSARTEISSSSDEFKKTMEIGCSLGYDMEGSDSLLKEVLVVEGDILVPK
ncbi:hypothetical protein LXL04_038619 [Taraxacum kok-saghyz]